jgi:cytochrome c oxidase cbb3-type subunit I/II
MYLVGMFIMLVNIFKTIATGPKTIEDEQASAPALEPFALSMTEGQAPHRILEGLPAVFTGLTLLAVIVGGVVQITPLLMAPDFKDAYPYVKPYRPLELVGRDIYIREGCYVCHSQMIRPLKFDVARYGDYSRSEESMYDHPFQWGSRRIGPDLAREGGKYQDLWHFRHMLDPRVVSPNSIMPAYPWLFDKKTNFDILERKFAVMRVRMPSASSISTCQRASSWRKSALMTLWP